MFDCAPKRLLSSLLVCMLGVAMLGADSSRGALDTSGRFGRVGGNLVCMCSCGQMLLQCNHVNCPTSGPMIEELQAQLAGPNGTGADSLILNWFVAKYGAAVLAAPIRGGFDVVAWVVPLSTFVIAILGTAFLVRLWTQRRGRLAPGVAGVPAIEVDEDLRERIRRETEY